MCSTQLSLRVIRKKKLESNKEEEEGCRFRVAGFKFQVPVVRIRVSGVGFLVLGGGCRVSDWGFRVRIPECGSRVQDSGFRVSESRRPKAMIKFLSTSTPQDRGWETFEKEKTGVSLSGRATCFSNPPYLPTGVPRPYENTHPTRTPLGP